MRFLSYMPVVRKVGRAFVPWALIVFLCFSSFAAWRVSQLAKSSRDAAITANDVLWQTRTTVRDADWAVNIIRSEVHHLLLELGLTAEEGRKLSIYERQLIEKESPQLIAKMNQALDNTNLVLTSSHTTIDTLNDTLKPVKPLIESTTPLVKSATKAVDDIDKAATNPDIPLIASHIKGMTASGDQILADGAKVVHKATDPAPKSRARRILGGGAVALEKILEMLYYAHGL